MLDFIYFLIFFPAMLKRICCPIWFVHFYISVLCFPQMISHHLVAHPHAWEQIDSSLFHQLEVSKSFINAQKRTALIGVMIFYTVGTFQIMRLKNLAMYFPFLLLRIVLGFCLHRRLFFDLYFIFLLQFSLRLSLLPLVGWMEWTAWVEGWGTLDQFLPPLAS